MEIAVPPETKSFTKLRAAAAECLVCPWAKKSTQTVFGEGPAHASIMFLGEQPGDKEDLAGHPSRPWLAREITALQPKVIVALGATAAQSVCDRAVKITKERGQWIEGEPRVLVSWHPSAILRAEEPTRARMREELRADLGKVWKHVRAQ